MNNNKTPLKTALSILLPLALFSLALFALSRQLHALHLKDILASFKSVPGCRILAAFVITACGYLILTGYDFLALRHLKIKLPFRKTAKASFVSTAISYNVGLNLVASGALRFRLYSYYGVSPAQIAQIIPFCSLSSWSVDWGLSTMIICLSFGET
jgi:phosphatidylglycerol lysyltransferase